MGCNILLENGSRILLQDGTSALLQDGCTPTSGGSTGCDILLQSGDRILLQDGASHLLLDGCTPSSASVSPTGGSYLIPVSRLRQIKPAPLFDDSDEAVAIALLTSLRRRRKLNG